MEKFTKDPRFTEAVENFEVANRLSMITMHNKVANEMFLEASNKSRMLTYELARDYNEWVCVISDAIKEAATK